MTSKLFAVGLNVHHDTSACVISSKGLFAAEEERWSGVKHHIETTSEQYAFPHESLRACLNAAELNIDDIRTVWVPRLSRVTREEAFGAALPREVQLVRSVLDVDVRLVGHHEAHALSGVLWGARAPAAALCIDGGGTPGRYGASGRERATGYLFDGSDLTLVYEGPTIRRLTDDGKPQRVDSSLGHFYRNLAIRCIPPGDEPEGSMMALAGFGRPSAYLAELRSRVSFGANGVVTIDPDLGNFNPDGPVRLGPETWLPRDAASKSAEERALVAFAGQTVFEELVLHIATHLRRVTGADRLVFSGGCALNAQVNGVLAERSGFATVMIPPAPHDAGTAVGAALAAWCWSLKQAPPDLTGAPYWGPPIHDIGSVDDTWIEVVGLDGPSGDELSAVLIAAGCIVGLLDGRMELGPRALGHRSIIARPDRRAVSDRLNRLKKRADYRPLAPAVLEDEWREWFVGDPDSYMNRVAHVRPERRIELEGAVHIDGTARAQVVGPRVERLHGTLQAFHSLVGLPCLLNTSFNRKGAPIIRSGADALLAGSEIGLDAIRIGTRLWIRRDWSRRIASLQLTGGGSEHASVEVDEWLATYLPAHVDSPMEAALAVVVAAYRDAHHEALEEVARALRRLGRLGQADARSMVATILRPLTTEAFLAVRPLVAASVGEGAADDLALVTSYRSLLKERERTPEGAVDALQSLDWPLLVAELSANIANSESERLQQLSDRYIGSHAHRLPRDVL